MQQGTFCSRAVPTFCAFRSRPKSKAKSRKARAPGIASHKVAESVSLNGTGPHVVEDQPAVPASPAQEPPPSVVRPPSYKINVIPHSRWPNGVPAVMGAHLMASGAVAPISTSEGPGVGGVPHLFFYPEGVDDIAVVQYANEKAGVAGLAEIVQEAAESAIKARGAFTLVLSGGSLFRALAPLIGLPGADYSKWHIAFVDERNVPHSSPESNLRGADEAFLSKVPIPREQIHAISPGLPVEQAAVEYAGQLLRLPPSVLPRNSAGFPVFDLIILGIGPDGHIASLFPNRKQTAAKEGWVLPVPNSPKPPAERITMTLPVINSAAHVAMVAFGENKAEVVQRALEVQALPGALPAQLLRPSAGRLTWLLDCASAETLTVSRWEKKGAFPRSTLPTDS